MVPVLFPFLFHWKTGEVPPLTAIAVKETGVPEDTVVCEAEIVTEGVTVGGTFTVTPLLLIQEALPVHLPITVNEELETAG